MYIVGVLKMCGLLSQDVSLECSLYAYEVLVEDAKTKLGLKSMGTAYFFKVLLQTVHNAFVVHLNM